MAKYTRGEVSTMLLAALNMATRITAARSLPAIGPSTPAAASEATRSARITPAGPSTAR